MLKNVSVQIDSTHNGYRSIMQLIRSPIAKTDQLFCWQPVVMEYIIDRFRGYVLLAHTLKADRAPFGLAIYKLLWFGFWVREPFVAVEIWTRSFPADTSCTTAKLTPIGEVHFKVVVQPWVEKFPLDRLFWSRWGWASLVIQVHIPGAAEVTGGITIDEAVKAVREKTPNSNRLSFIQKYLNIYLTIQLFSFATWLLIAKVVYLDLNRLSLLFNFHSIYTMQYPPVNTQVNFSMWNSG